MEKLISIVMPVYNAVEFLEEGIGSIRAQTHENWELIAVNDGSKDNSVEVIEKLCEGMPQKLKLVTQENKGGFGARNTGLDNVEGDFIAFFDCDDSWYPHHLAHCLEQFEACPEVDWVFAANKIVDLTNDTVVEESNFHENGKKRPLLQLETKKVGELNLITDSRAIEFQIIYGLNCGQQFSLIKSEVFKDYRFRSDYRNEGADQVSVIRSLKQGYKFGYLEDVHGIYCIHGNNASAGCKGAAAEKYIRLRTALVRGFEEVREEEKLEGEHSKAIDQRIAKELFWDLGYNVFWMGGDKKSAIKNFWAGIKRNPFSLPMWKTFILSLIRPAPAAAS